jgi:hypothetical protein
MICSQIDYVLVAVSTAKLDVLPIRVVDCGTDLARWGLKIVCDWGGGGEYTVLV